MGYVPHIKAENMFGKTYGDLTNVAVTDSNAAKSFSYSQGLYTSTIKGEFVDKLESRRTGGDLGRSYPFKTSNGFGQSGIKSKYFCRKEFL